MPVVQKFLPYIKHNAAIPIYQSDIMDDKLYKMKMCEIKYKDAIENKHEAELAKQKLTVPKGTSVLTSEPFVHVSTRRYREKYCDYCLQTLDDR